jgi:hypothetical protein
MRRISCPFFHDKHMALTEAAKTDPPGGCLAPTQKKPDTWNRRKRVCTFDTKEAMLRPECWNEGDGIMSDWGVMAGSSAGGLNGRECWQWCGCGKTTDYQLPTTSYQLPTPWNPAASLFRGGYF